MEVEVLWVTVHGGDVDGVSQARPWGLRRASGGDVGVAGYARDMSPRTTRHMTCSVLTLR